jgi:uncharacterized membrane protein YecN with MAPEG domain
MQASLEVAAVYIGLSALLLLVLAYNVGARRGAQDQLQPGDTGDAGLVRAIRAHGNFAEHAPITLLVLLCLALLGVQPFWLHLFGGTFVVGRVIGAVGMMRDKHPNPLRFIGNLVTGLALLLGGGALIWLALL